MAKFTQSQLDRIKRELKIKDLAEQAGIRIQTRKNGQFVTRCLWHDDNDPSLFIHPTKNLFNCFGCDAGGDVIQWVMKRENLAFADAVEPDPRMSSSFNGKKQHRLLRQNRKLASCPLDMSASDQKFLDQVIDFYHQRLLDDRQAQDYLLSRGILDCRSAESS